MTIVVRSPAIEDVKAMAKVHVESWQETYQGTMPDEILYAPDFLQRREQLWNGTPCSLTAIRINSESQ
ncbi:hypothetical protein [Brevibacterium sp. 239c]|uniref:hypothetical protein n=1 Tax=Brevibacterium sp. 239c TaxID=1965356 RepID=UPI001C60A644|nr:hypothetical protein [Brevibacterium sp. 239c]